MTPAKSLERRARKWAYTYFDNFDPGMDFYSPSLLTETLASFALSESSRAYKNGWNEAIETAVNEVCFESTRPTHMISCETIYQRIRALRRRK